MTTLLLATALPLFTTQISPVPVTWPGDLVQESELRRIVTKLASDDWKGRDTPSEGLDAAADFLGAELAKAGARPGPNGTHFLVSNDQGKPVRNVIGILPGSDPELKREYVLVTAHYDHIGEGADGADRIFNGANDNASSVAGGIAIARALAKVPLRRSVAIVFFWGEEKGFLGSKDFVAKSPIPLREISVVLNLEQIGRTDDVEGDRKNAVAVTGLDYTTLQTTLEAVGKASQIRVERHPRYSDAFFRASDNWPFAQIGVPAVTACTAFMFPDYHRPGDHADKLNYPNMTGIVRYLARVVRSLATDAPRVTWVESDKTARFREAAKSLADGG